MLQSADSTQPQRSQNQTRTASRKIFLGIILVLFGVINLALIFMQKPDSDAGVLLGHRISFGLNKSAVLMHTINESVKTNDTLDAGDILYLYDINAELYQASESILIYSTIGENNKINTVLSAIISYYRGDIRAISEQILREPVVTSEQKRRLQEIEQDLMVLSEQFPARLWHDHQYTEINQRIRMICSKLHLKGDIAKIIYRHCQ